jgi:hypothetical protein
MALLLVVRVWLPPTFVGIDPERRGAGKQSEIHEMSLTHH